MPVLVLVGEGDERDAVAKKAADMGLAADVRLIPPVGDVEKWYAAMDLFLFPSLWEGLPVVLIEAQTSGLPCVISDTVTTEAKVCDNARYMSLNETDDAWARALLNALNEPNDRLLAPERVAAAGYDIRLVAKELEDFYLRIAGNK